VLKTRDIKHTHKISNLGNTHTQIGTNN